MPFEDSLLIFRDEINNIDKNIVKLLAKRKTLVLKIAKSKIKNNQPIRDLNRENKLLQKLTNLGKKNNLSPEYITQLFQLIIQESIIIQEKLLQNFHHDNNLTPSRFSFLGPKGSYSYIATCEYIKKSFKNYILQEYSTFEDVLLSVEKNESDYAILPIENSCSGFINETLDLLKKTNLFIFGEINIVINHCLLSIKKIELHKIKKIYSHPQPFQQCSDFINKFPQWEMKYTKSTSDAMRKITEYNQITNAALGSEIGSKIYGLHILLKNLANQENNITKFILLHRNAFKIPLQTPSKTVLILTEGEKSSDFSKILSIFQENKILIKTETSKNFNTKLQGKIFYIDVQLNLSSKVMENIINEIKKITKSIKILGCYSIKNIFSITP